MNAKRRAKKADPAPASSAAKGEGAPAETLTAADEDFVAGEPRAAAASPGEPAVSPEALARIEGIEAEVLRLREEIEAERAQWRAREDGLLRNLAERENQIRRLHRDQQQADWLFRSDLLTPLLEVLDDFDRALAHAGEEAETEFGKGTALIAQRLQETLEKLGLEPIAARGAKFDPACHEAIMTVATDEVERGYVVDEVQRGYRLGDRVLRPSKVSVAG